MIDQLRFPVGRFESPSPIIPSHIEDWISDIESFPKRVESLVAGKSSSDLAQTYRPGGWTAAQVIHHCADSHMNSVIRFKLALTEDVPTIRPYYEDRWAELADSRTTEVQNSIQFLIHLHFRWVVLLRSLNEADLKREFIHPEDDQKVSLAENIGIYAWHCRHHLAHIRIALKSA